MRFLVKAEWPVEAGNEAISSGRLGELVQSILEEQKPEAVYFLASNGKRAAYLIVNMDDVSEMPKIAEPWFLAFNASLDAVPVMVPEYLMKASDDIAAAVAKYGQS